MNNLIQNNQLKIMKFILRYNAGFSVVVTPICLYFLDYPLPVKIIMALSMATAVLSSLLVFDSITINKE